MCSVIALFGSFLSHSASSHLSTQPSAEVVQSWQVGARYEENGQIVQNAANTADLRDPR